jgi:hypothetical protein
MDEDGHLVMIPLTMQAASVSQLLDCLLLHFDITIDPTQVQGDLLESSYTLKSGVAISNIAKSNAVTPQMTSLRNLLKLKEIMEAVHNFAGANPVMGTIKTPEARSKWLECLPEGWMHRVHEYYLYIFVILSKCL